MLALAFLGGVVAAVLTGAVIATQPDIPADPDPRLEWL
jgi:hypothetical protein